jgi:hypothetical protein
MPCFAGFKLRGEADLGGEEVALSDRTMVAYCGSP